MRHKKVLFLFLLFCAGFLRAQEAGYEIKIKIEGIDEKMLYLGGNYGAKNMIVDSAVVSSKHPGLFVFKGKGLLHSGIYVVANKNAKVYLDIIVDKSRHFSISATLDDLMRKREITGSDENKILFEFEKNSHIFSNRIEGIKAKIRKFVTENNADSVQYYYQMYVSTNKDMKAYMERLIEAFPGTLFAKFQKSLLGVEPPEIYKADGITIDTAAQRQYAFQHFFDNIDFSDERLLRIPGIDKKVVTYLTELIPQNPDTVIKEIDRFLLLTKESEEVRKYHITWMFLYFDTPLQPDLDAVFVHLNDAYCEKGDCAWLSDGERKLLKRKADRKRRALLGKQIPPIAMFDRDSNLVRTTDITSDYTILWFWDPDCDHCLIETPKLFEFYDLYKNHYRFEVYAVSVTEDFDRWIKFIEENKLDWMNVGVATGLPNYDFREYLDILTTPAIFLIDREHRIIAKQFPIDSIESVFQNITNTP